MMFPVDFFFFKIQGKKGLILFFFHLNILLGQSLLAVILFMFYFLCMTYPNMSKFTGDVNSLAGTCLNQQTEVIREQILSDANHRRSDGS